MMPPTPQLSAVTTASRALSRLTREHCVAPRVRFGSWTRPLSGPLADISGEDQLFREVPCVDGSWLARTIFTSQGLVGAAMCSAC
jgi:hypothetical protein